MTPLHMHHGGAELRVIGLVISGHVAGMYAFSPIVGWLSDRLGRVPMILLGAGILGVALLLAGAAPPGAPRPRGRAVPAGRRLVVQPGCRVDPAHRVAPGGGAAGRAGRRGPRDGSVRCPRRCARRRRGRTSSGSAPSRSASLRCSSSSLSSPRRSGLAQTGLTRRTDHPVRHVRGRTRQAGPGSRVHRPAPIANAPENAGSVLPAQTRRPASAAAASARIGRREHDVEPSRPSGPTATTRTPLRPTGSSAPTSGASSPGPPPCGAGGPRGRRSVRVRRAAPGTSRPAPIIAAASRTSGQTEPAADRRPRRRRPPAPSPRPGTTTPARQPWSTLRQDQPVGRPLAAYCPRRAGEHERRCRPPRATTRRPATARRGSRTRARDRRRVRVPRRRPGSRGEAAAPRADPSGHVRTAVGRWRPRRTGSRGTRWRGGTAASAPAPPGHPAADRRQHAVRGRQRTRVPTAPATAG